MPSSLRKNVIFSKNSNRAIPLEKVGVYACDVFSTGFF